MSNNQFSRTKSGWGLNFGLSRKNNVTEAVPVSQGFHSLQSELVKESAAWDLESAREAAVREVQTVVSVAGSDSLSRLAKVREEYEQQLAGVEVQLSLVAGRQADEAKAVLTLVDRCREGIDKVEKTRDGLEEKIETAITAVPEYPLLRKVFQVRANVKRTLQDLEKIMAVPTELKRIEAQLSSDGDLNARDHLLPDVHKSLMQLERRQEAAMFRARASAEERESLENQFGKLERFFERVENRLWQIIRNCTVEAQARPAVLVKVLQIIERQEKQDEKARQALLYAEETGQPVSVGQVRGWYAACINTIKEYIEQKFEMLVGSLAQEAPVDIPLMVAEHEKLIEELTLVKDLVEPCFPPKYHVFDLFVASLHSLLVELVHMLMNKHASTLSTKDIIDIVNWLRDYHGQLANLEAHVTPVLTDDIDQLMQGYNYQTESMMRNWSNRILDEDLKVPPESGPDGKLYTIAPIDLFKMIGQQFEVVDVLGLERSTYNLAMTVTNVLDDYRACVEDVMLRLWPTLELTHICAQVNNSSRMMDGCMQLLEDLESKLMREKLEDIELQMIVDGFSAIGKLGAVAVVNVFFEDIKPLFPRLFTAKWMDHDQERVMESIMATIKDYSLEVRDYLYDTYYRKVLIEALERLVKLYIAQFLKGTIGSTEVDFSGSMRRDKAHIEQGFLECGLPPKMLATRIHALTLFTKLAAINLEVSEAHKHGDVERFAMDVMSWYDEALVMYPDMPCDALARALRIRSDIDSKTRNAVLLKCNSVYEQHTAEKREGPKSIYFAEIYHELGAAMGPYVPNEGMLSNLKNLATGPIRIKAGVAKRKQSVEADLVEAAAAVQPAASTGRQPGDERGANAIDIMFRLEL